MTEEIKKLETIQEVLSSIQLNLKVSKEQNNKFGNYKYRKAEDILEAVKKELGEEKYPPCSIITSIHPAVVGDRFFIRCSAEITLAETSLIAEGWAELETSKKGMDLAQLTGAATSYAKKYALGNLFAIDDSKDDPDSKDNTKSKPTSIIKKLSASVEAETTEVFAKKNEDQFLDAKRAITGCGSVEELEAAWKSMSKEIKSLEKRAPDLYAEICKIGGEEKVKINDE